MLRRTVLILQNVLNSRASFALALALPCALANAQFGAKGEFRALASNNDLSTGENLPSESYYAFDFVPKPAVDYYASLIGNTGTVSGSAHASAGVLKARAVGNSSFHAVPPQVPGTDSDIYGAGDLKTTVSFVDEITIAASGFFQFSWAVSGGAQTTPGEDDATFHTFAKANGAMSVVDTVRHFPVGHMDFVSDQYGLPAFGADGNKFSTFLNAGEVLDIYGQMDLEAECHGGGTMFIDYGHSAYTVIQQGEFGELGSGGFTSVSGYKYGPAAVPEPAAFAALGLGVLAVARRRRS